MNINEAFGKLADRSVLEATAAALRANGMTVHVLDTGEQAKGKVLEIVPDGSEVMTMSSMTLESTSIAKAINESGRFTSVRNRLMAMDRERDGAEMRRLGGAPEWTVGSVHAVTREGQLLIASNSGSQHGAYAYGARRVIWVIGSQKIVKDIPEGLRRIHEYSYPLEDERARKVYGMPSGVNKILVVNKEIQSQRATVILVKEKLGF